MIQGDKIKVTISDLNNEGEGVVRAGDERFVVFVADALPGEEVEARLVTKKKNYGTAKVLRRLSESPERITPACGIFGRCGGCQLQHISYGAQLRMKRKTVVDALERIGGIEAPNVHECVPSPELWGYRNKASLPVQSLGGESLRAGFYRPRSHDIIPYSDCPVLLPQINRNLNGLLTALREEGFCGAREGRRSLPNELIRHIVVRQAQFGEDSLCAVIGRRPLSKKEEKSLRSAAQKIKGLSGMVYNINDSPGNFIWGGRTIPIYGAELMSERLGRYKFTFEASSFFQVNSAQALSLYEYAAGLALDGAPGKILELYSGVGSLTAFLAAGGAEVTAVESWLPAAKYIAGNAERNGIKKIVPHTAQAEDIAESLSGSRCDVVVVDPPRSGCDEKVIAAMLKTVPERIVYVSCNPATLARDIKLLAEGGYTPLEARPFDMFPQTGHVETVVLLSRETNPLTVEVRMEVETGEVKEHPTYKRIQEYVQEKYGFKVHTAYIAEVKRMVGLDMHKAPNAVEQRKHEYHPCPPEKVEAIKDALRHFGLIAE